MGSGAASGRTAALVAALATPGAFAQPPAGEPPAEAIRLTYDAPTGCPDFADFEARLRSRTTRFRIAEKDEPARLFVVVVLGGEGRSAAVLSVHDPTGPTATRKVTASSCDEAVSALALIVAVAIDPGSAAQVSRPRTTPPEPPLAARPAEVVPAPEPIRDEPHPPRRQATPGRRSRHRWSAGFDVETTTAVAPGLTPAGRVFAAVGWPSSPGAFGVGLRWSVAQGLTRGAKAPSDRRASLSWTAARLELCALRSLGSIEVAPCAGLDGGILRAAGAEGVAPRRSTIRPWITAAALGRAGRTVGIATLELQVALLVPLHRDSYHLTEPEETVYEIPPLGGATALGLAVRFR